MSLQADRQLRSGSGGEKDKGADKKGSSNQRSSSTDQKIDLILNSIEELKVQQKDLVTKVENSNSLIKLQDEKLSKCFNDIVFLKSKNEELSREVMDLKSKLRQSMQYQRANSLEIQGVPMVPGEIIMEVAKSVARAVRFDLKTEMVDAIHRLGTVRPSETEGSRGAISRPPGIIIKFVRRIDRDELFRLGRVKWGFKPAEIGLTGENQIFINQSLTSEMRYLFNEARKVKKLIGFDYVWLRGQKIFMRQNPRSQVILISSLEDIRNVAARYGPVPPIGMASDTQVDLSQKPTPGNPDM